MRWAVEQYIRLRNPDDRLNHKHAVEDIMFAKVAKMMDSQDTATQLLAMQAWDNMREMDKIEARALVQVYGDSLESMTAKYIADVQAEMLRTEKQDTALSLPAMFAEAFAKHEQMKMLGERPTDLPRQDIIDPERGG